MRKVDWQRVERVSVLGLGKSGLSAVRFLQHYLGDRIARQELILEAFETRSASPGVEAARQLLGKQRVVTRQWQLEDTLAADVLVVSPGIDLRQPAIKAAQDAGVRVIGDVELFAQQVQRPVVAITGSNGKSTVTRMVEYLARQQGIKALAAGNIGLPVLEALQQQEKQELQLYVLELSSFQLETLESLQPVAATVLNISPDHQDRYYRLTDYIAAKKRIYRNAELCVLNRQETMYWPTQQAPALTFGPDQSDADFGIQRRGEETWITYQSEPILAAHQLALQGIHNLLNVQAALALALAVGVPVAAGAGYIREFEGLPHRCQLVTERLGVKWVNDSKATNIGATEAAIKGLRPLVNGRLILIAGGVGKGADFSTLQPSLKQVDGLITIGEDGALIGQYVNGSRHAGDLQQAVALADQLTESGDLVLLSPACASFDQFDDFEHRGLCFSRAVEGLYEQSA
ncbi:UDP-N-acetylmuramoyl-L-alanine--D-glutamate ligase [Idiomarina seosinensis]|uniref:UDP-N-acetylmuramoyl-L-alanine--D-glutamate ligase n=1 Tax=Idiomarina seosinensis TaxID=281739 RepID=UPI0038508257